MTAHLVLGGPAGSPPAHLSRAITATEPVVRRFSVSVAAGTLAGALWVGLASRVVMHVIAVSNPGAAGLTSDDGFTIGESSLAGSLNLVFAGVVVGALGGCLYVALRGLRIGPEWFRLLSITLGPAVVAVRLLIHPEEVDFTLLGPPVLTVGLFFAVAWGFTTTVAVLAERWLAPGGLAERAPRWLVTLAALPAVTVLPAVVVMALGRAALPWLRPFAGPAAWSARAVLAVVFGASLMSLGGTLVALA